MTVASAQRPLRTPACRVAAGQLALPLRPPVVVTCVARRPRRPQRARPEPSQQAVQLVIAFPAKPRRHRPVNPHAAANALALQHLDIAKTVAGNISRRTGHPKEDIEQIAMLGILQAARRYSPERGSFRPYARTYANGEVYHYLRDKGFLIKVPASWRELHARGLKLMRLGVEAAEVPGRLGVSAERWREIVEACSQRVVAWGVECSDAD
ncbi:MULTISPECIES: sigma-70 family RNA polymerase sigma factor [unclassified Cyanobium]|uniref:sigma-70 family RNA polymerase sigma factor n=1 Tax=unclassified Cyanobium TaxID=2627006 RepID=UPI0020CCD54D|nr:MULTISPECIES: sigma factor [unclassified Cyanobium]MCP9860959.1 RNA polymerase subunit sigma-70 [Cyanobium sp. Cruz-8H5]MCP9868212.1 RNA polymerase subunit sigma-70 [Cyanobium sp. Cruz-8D1]